MHYSDNLIPSCLQEIHLSYKNLKYKKTFLCAAMFLLISPVWLISGHNGHKLIASWNSIFRCVLEYLRPILVVSLGDY